MEFKIQMFQAWKVMDCNEWEGWYGVNGEINPLVPDILISAIKSVTKKGRWAQMG